MQSCVCKVYTYNIYENGFSWTLMKVRTCTQRSSYSIGFQWGSGLETNWCGCDLDLVCGTLSTPWATSRCGMEDCPGHTNSELGNVRAEGSRLSSRMTLTGFDSCKNESAQPQPCWNMSRSSPVLQISQWVRNILASRPLQVKADLKIYVTGMAKSYPTVM